MGGAGGGGEGPEGEGRGWRGRGGVKGKVGHKQHAIKAEEINKEKHSYTKAADLHCLF